MKKFWKNSIVVSLVLMMCVMVVLPTQVDAAALLTYNQGKIVAAKASEYVNKVDYKSGGYTNANQGLDNIGFVKYVFNKYNIEIPYSLDKLATTGAKVTNVQRGDILFFTNSSGSRLSFVGIYVGNGYFVGSSAAFGGVVKKKVSNYQHLYYGARRMYAPSSTPTTNPNIRTTSSGTSSTSVGARIVDEANDYLGRPYVFGSTAYTTSSFDCSSFVQRSVIDAGLGTLPRTARSQAAYMAKNGKAVSRSQLQAGDLLFWKNMGSHVAPGTVSHVGIYVGNGRFIHAFPNKGVIYSTFTSYFTDPNRVAGAYRIVKKVS